MLKDAIVQMANVFPPGILMRGQDYHKKGYVLNIRLSEGLLKARVKGSSHHIYDVHMDLKTWPHRPARCSCPYTTNCKHAAACLFSLNEREKVQDSHPNPTFDAWLNDLRNQEAEKNKPHEYEISYLLQCSFGEFDAHVVIKLAMAKRLKSGKLGRKNIFHSITESRKQYFSPEDEDIVASLLFKCGVENGAIHFAIRNSELLERILKTDRAYFMEEQDIPLTLGDDKNGALAWEIAKDGTQHLIVKIEKEITPIFLDKPWYFDSENQIMGALNLPHLKQSKLLLNAPPVRREEVPELAKKLQENYPELPPLILYEKTTVTITPEPLIRFDVLETMNEDFFVAKVIFVYQGLEVKKEEKLNPLFHLKNEVLQEISRDFLFETSKMEELKKVIQLRSPTSREQSFTSKNIEDFLILKEFHHENDLQKLYQEAIPELKNKGWRVEFSHPIYQEIIEAASLEWFSELEESGTDFFSYQLGILIDGKPTSIVTLVADFISRLGKDGLDSFSDDTIISLPLSSGKVLAVDYGRIKPLLRFLLQFGLRNIKEGEPLQISRYQLILMQETEQAMTSVLARWKGGETLRNQLQQLLTQSIPATALPKGLKAQLRDYQMEGLHWLQFLRACQFGGVLADDMGLGKTVQTLAHLLIEKEQCRLKQACLIVAPTSLVYNWYEEAKRFTPELRVLVFHGVERHQVDFSEYDVVVSTYGLIQRDKSRFVDYAFYYLILDEAQSIKNARTKTTQIIQQIQAHHRLCLSGTPLENHLGELWSLYHFLMPGLLGDPKQFRQFFKVPIEKFNDQEKRQILMNRVKPFLLRRTKNQVARELPAKTEMTRYIELTGRQRDLYEAIRMSMESKVREAIARQGIGKSHIVLLDALLKLRQVCCDPQLLSIPEAEIAFGSSAKLDALLELLDSLIEEGRRILIFSQFTSMLELIEEKLKARKYHYLKLTGQTKNRQALVATFQEGNIPIFLISLKAGGTGLNLTSADTVIHYDPWWNPAVEDQATDRSHRIGQDNPVFVYKLITSGTVEEAILAMQAKKRQLFEGILSNQMDTITTMTQKDIEQFFMPLENS